jgi:hypothetical protein
MHHPSSRRELRNESFRTSEIHWKSAREGWRLSWNACERLPDMFWSCGSWLQSPNISKPPDVGTLSDFYITLFFVPQSNNEHALCIHVAACCRGCLDFTDRTDSIRHHHGAFLHGRQVHVKGRCASSCRRLRLGSLLGYAELACSVKTCRNDINGLTPWCRRPPFKAEEGMRTDCRHIYINRHPYEWTKIRRQK